MDTKEVRIQAPEGWIIDTHTSNGKEVIVTYKEDNSKKLTWEEINDAVSSNPIYDACTIELANRRYYAETDGFYPGDLTNMHNHTIAYCKLIIIAKYLNGDWEPTYDDNAFVNEVYFITKDAETYDAFCTNSYNNLGAIYFKDESTCRKAIRIMDKDLNYLF